MPFAKSAKATPTYFRARSGALALQGLVMDNAIFVVNKEPYCLWEIDVHERNKEFLSGIDPEYFDYLIELHLHAEDEKRAAIALRSALHHALETMFSLLGAYIQAPNCVYAWVAKCSNRDLRDLVERIENFDTGIYTNLLIEQVSWEEVSKMIFREYEPGTDKNKNTAALFAELWSQLAREFVDQSHIDEYNSIKHGFRIRSGGFSLAVGIEPEYGVSPPREEMKTIGHSEYGTTYFKLEPIGKAKDNRNLRSRRHSINWRIEKTVLLLQLASMSIANISSALKIANGFDATKCKYFRPTEDAVFKTPWSFSPGITGFNMDFVISDSDVAPTTKESLLKMISDQE